MANRRPVVSPTSGQGASGKAATSGTDATSASGSPATARDSKRESASQRASRFSTRRTADGATEVSVTHGTAGPADTATLAPVGASTSKKPGTSAAAASKKSAATGSRAHPAPAARTRTARLRLVHLDPWSVMKTAFLLSIALGIVAIVAVTIIWGVLGAAGVWDSINASVQKTIGDPSKPFNITDYVGTSRVVGFTMIAAVIDVVVFTALATLGAFIYNLAATLLGGVEMTLSEDR